MIRALVLSVVLLQPAMARVAPNPTANKLTVERVEPSMAQALPLGELVTVTFKFETTERDWIRVSPTLVTAGGQTGGTATKPTIVSGRKGRGSIQFTVRDRPRRVDHIVLKMYNKGWEPLAEQIIPVDLTFGNTADLPREPCYVEVDTERTVLASSSDYDVDVVALDPPSPAVLEPSQPVHVKFKYKMNHPHGVLVTIMPYRNGRPARAYGYKPSGRLVMNTQMSTVHFTVHTPQHVDALHVKMWRHE